jgi:hypothetical protein
VEWIPPPGRVSVWRHIWALGHDPRCRAGPVPGGGAELTVQSRIREARYAEPMCADANRHIQELYAVPLKEFTSARNAKAAALQAAGHGEEAQTLRQLSRPSVSLWATNQLSRLAPKELGHFIDLVLEAGRRQLKDPRATAEAMKVQRRESTALTHRAAEAMTKAGYRASPAALERVSNTLLGAAADRHLCEALRHGRLTTELSAPGFEVLAGLRTDADLRLLRGGNASRRKSEQATTLQVREQVERERLVQEAEAARRHAMQRAAVAERASQEVQDLERQLAEARRRRLAAQREATAAAKRIPRPTGG